MKRRLRARGMAFTLVEILVGLSLATIVFAGFALGSVAVQKTFAAVGIFASAQSDQMRALDYIARDVRRGQNLTVTTSPPTLSLTAQIYNDPTTGQPIDPTLSGGGITYGGSTTITYSLSGSNLLRQESGNSLVIASSVTAFGVSLDPADPASKTVLVTLSYASPLRWEAPPSSEATMTLQAKAASRQ